jgi:hypothetical protein
MNRLHTRFTGDYQTNQGTSKPYRAADPDLLLWVHMAFMESFLVCHEWYSLNQVSAFEAVGWHRELVERSWVRSNLGESNF